MDRKHAAVAMEVATMVATKFTPCAARKRAKSPPLKFGSPVTGSTVRSGWDENVTKVVRIRTGTTGIATDSNSVLMRLR